MSARRVFLGFGFLGKEVDVTLGHTLSTGLLPGPETVGGWCSWEHACLRRGNRGFESRPLHHRLKPFPIFPLTWRDAIA